MARLLFESDRSEDPHAQLERAFIEEYLRGHGTTLAALHELPADRAALLLSGASLYASGRLTEVESRAHFVEDLHCGPGPAPRRSGPRRD